MRIFICSHHIFVTFVNLCPRWCVQIGEQDHLEVKPTNLSFVSAPAAAGRASDLEVAEDNSKATDIFISGVSGANSEIINGFYSPSQERGSDGRVLYVKNDELRDSVCIEHMSHTEGVWQVKTLSSRGTDQCFAGVSGGCALEACTSRTWKVGVGLQLVAMQSVKMLTGGEAKRAVRR